MLSNKKIIKIKRISKYVVIQFEGIIFLIIHLGMSGTLHLIKNTKITSKLKLELLKPTKIYVKEILNLFSYSIH